MTFRNPRKHVHIEWLENVDDAVAAGLNPPGERKHVDRIERAPSASGRQAARSS